MAQNFFNVDDRQGNAYTFLDVNHVSGTADTVSVDASAVSVTHSPLAGQTAIITEASPSAGVSLATAVANTGLRVLTVASGVVTGTFTIVVRHAGSAAGIGTFKVPHT
jgi:hypothetical protein